MKIARPKAAYRIGYIESKGPDWVMIGDVKIKSRVLRVNLDTAHRVFIFLATCGSELEEWSHQATDYLMQFWADMIKEDVLDQALQFLINHIIEQYEPGKTSSMSPGSLHDWPLPAQKEVFTILGNYSHEIGVKLTDSFLMIPNKTVSGMLFPTEESFKSCQLCPRNNCPNRGAPYDPSLFKKKYQDIKESLVSE